MAVTFASLVLCLVFGGWQREPKTPQSFPPYIPYILPLVLVLVYPFSASCSPCQKGWHILSNQLMGMGQLMVAI